VVTVSSSTENVGPTLSNKSVSVSESAAAGSILTTVAGSDANGDTLSYSITAGNTSGLFSINAISGEVKLSSPLDYETATKYTLTMNAADAALNTSATLIFNVTDENDNAPYFNGSNITTANLSMSSNTGTSITTMSASDSDGDSLTYSIVSGNDSGFIQIDSSNGAITTAKAFDVSSSIKYWDASSTVVASKEFSFLNMSEGVSPKIDLLVQVTDGVTSQQTNLFMVFPKADINETVSTSGSGAISFGQFGNGGSYKVYQTLTNANINSHINIADDVQKLADHLSAKTVISAPGIGSGDFDHSGVVNLADGTKIVQSILNGEGSELVLVDSLGSSSLTLIPGSSPTLYATVIGDLDASYAATL
jgi:hypothetical protein